MSEESEPLLDVHALQAYVDTVDLAEMAATGVPSTVAFFVALDRDPPRFAHSVLGWMSAAIQVLAKSNGVSVQEMAVRLRADGAK